jgi:hypothetical protein
MIGWAIFGMVMAAIIVLFILVFVLMNIGDLARYIKISSM